MVVPPAEVALRVEDVPVEPEIGFGQPAAAGPGLGQHRDGTLGLARGPGHQGEAAGGHRLPARIAELAGPGEGLLQQFGRSSRVSPGQLHLTAQRLRPRQERQPVVILGQLDRRVEVPGRRVQGAAEQADPAQHGQGVGLLPRRLGQRDRLLQVADGTPVTGTVAFHRA